MFLFKKDLALNCRELFCELRCAEPNTAAEDHANVLGTVLVKLMTNSDLVLSLLGNSLEYKVMKFYVIEFQISKI